MNGEVEKVADWVAARRADVAAASSEFRATGNPSSLNGVGELAENIVLAEKWLAERRLEQDTTHG